MRILGLLLIAFLPAISETQPPRGEPPADAAPLAPPDSIKEYPEAIRALRDHYFTAVGSVKHRVEIPTDDVGVIVKEWRYTFASKGTGSRRVIRERLDDPSENVKVVCVNGERAFELKKTRGDKDFSITSLDDVAATTTALVHLLDLYLDAPARMELLSLDKILEMANPSIQSTRNYELNGENLLEVNFTYFTRDRTNQYLCSIVVAPERSWALHEYEYKTAEGIGVFKGTVEYEGEANGVPTPRRVVNTTWDSVRNKLLEMDVFEFEDIQFTAPPDSDFTLAAFGLPELPRPPLDERTNEPTNSPRDERTSSAAFGIIGGALACLALAIFFRVRSARLKH